MTSLPAFNDALPVFQLLPDDEHVNWVNANNRGENVTSFLIAAANWTRDDGGGAVVDSDYDLSDSGEMEYNERIIVPVIFCIIIFSGCIGNLLVLAVVVRNREQFTNTTNLFIVNLAVADLIFLIFCVPFHAIIYTSISWPFGDAVCKLVHFAQFASMIASVYTLVAMSLDRFLAVGYPLRTKHLRTPPCALVVAVAVWTMSTLLASPWSVVYTVIKYPLGNDTDVVDESAFFVCADDWSKIGRSHRPTAFLVLFVVGFAIPLSVIGVLSVLTVRQLWATETANDGPSRRRSVIAKRRVTRLIAVVVGVFAVCWLPSHVFWLWANYFPLLWFNTYPFFYSRVAAHALSYANSSMNPIIYAFLSSRFRCEFRRAIRCHRPARAGLNRMSMEGSRSISTGSMSAVHHTRVSISPAHRDIVTRGVRARGRDGTGNDSQHVSRRCYHFRKPDSSRTSVAMMLMPMERTKCSSAPVETGACRVALSERYNRARTHNDLF